MKRFSSIVLLLTITTLSFGQKNKQADKPKLVIGIVVDQMRYEYLYRFYDDFGKNGFRKLMAKGMNCRNTNYNYVPTYTGPGHASIYTGTTPANHGIVANSWYSQKEGKLVNCVEDTNVTPVGGIDEYGKFSPARLKSNTITDQLKLNDSKSKVISVSLKNRGAILPGGHMSDGSYWFDYSNGKFVTSSFFKNSLPDWVNDFNNQNYPQKDLQKTWDLYLGSGYYTESREDNYPYEVLLPTKKTPTFPYDFKEMNEGRDNFGLYGYSPFSNTTLINLAIEGIRNEELGKDESTDFINISISATDIIGHAFGPYSKEIQDTYIRLDQDIAQLISYLDKEIGKNEYVLFLTADHAVEPIPQYLIEKKLAANYFAIDDFKDTLNHFLSHQFKLKGIDSNQVVAVKNQQIYFNTDFLNHKDIESSSILNKTKSFILSLDGIKNVFLKNDLLMSVQLNELNELINKGIHNKESGDVIFMLEPGTLTIGEHTKADMEGTSHGSPYGYDTDVPLLWYGGQTPVKEVLRKIEITDITATLQRILNLPKANGCTGRVIDEYFEK